MPRGPAGVRARASWRDATGTQPNGQVHLTRTARIAECWRMSQAARLLLCLVVLLAAVPATAAATTYTVDSTGDLPDSSPATTSARTRRTPRRTRSARCARRSRRPTRTPAPTRSRSTSARAATIAPFSQLPPIVGPARRQRHLAAGLAGTPVIQLERRERARRHRRAADHRRHGEHGPRAGHQRLPDRHRHRRRRPGRTASSNNWIGTDAAGSAEVAEPPLGRLRLQLAQQRDRRDDGRRAQRRLRQRHQRRRASTAEWGKGIEIFGAGADGNKVLGNYIGTDLDRLGAARQPPPRRLVRVRGGAGTAPDTRRRRRHRRRPQRDLRQRRGGHLRARRGRHEDPRQPRSASGSTAASLGNGFRGIAIESAPDAQVGGTDARRAQRRLRQRLLATATEEYEGIIVFGPKREERHGRGQLRRHQPRRRRDHRRRRRRPATRAPASRSRPAPATSARRHDSVVGGSTAATRNVVSGNGAGVAVINEATNNRVEGNYVGTDKTGTVALPNHSSACSPTPPTATRSAAPRPACATSSPATTRTASASRTTRRPPTTPRTTASRATTSALAADGTTPLPQHGQRDLAARRHRRQRDRLQPRRDRRAHGDQREDLRRRRVQPDRAQRQRRRRRGRHLGARRHCDPNLAAEKNTIRGNRLADNSFLGIDLGTGNPTANDVDDADDGRQPAPQLPGRRLDLPDLETGQQPRSAAASPGPTRTSSRSTSTRAATPTRPAHGEGRTWEAAVTPERTARSRRLHGLHGRVPHRDGDRRGRQHLGVLADLRRPRRRRQHRQRRRRALRRLGDQRPRLRRRRHRRPAAQQPRPTTPTRPRRTSSSRSTTWTRSSTTTSPSPARSTDVVRRVRGRAGRRAEGHRAARDAGAAPTAPTRTIPRRTAAQDGLARAGRRRRLRRPPRRRPGAAVRRPLRHARGARQRRRTCWKILGAKAMAFRYAIFGHTFEECADCSGVADDGGDNLFVTPRRPGATRDLQRDGGGAGRLRDAPRCKRRGRGRHVHARDGAHVPARARRPARRRRRTTTSSRTTSAS